MADFKCISCGAVKESVTSCSCPECGYRMFPTPFERSELLIKEIQRFLGKLRPVEIELGDIQGFRKPSTQDLVDDASPDKYIYQSEDTARFPDFQKIQRYVCGASKTEQFLANLANSIEQIRKHIKTAYLQNYEVSISRLLDRATELDAVLKDALRELDITCMLPAIDLPNIKLQYSETPDEELLPLAEDLLESLTALKIKIGKFIKQNNIYGTLYQKKPKKGFKLDKECSNLTALKRCKTDLERILSKKYVVDIFSDGSEELAEMLHILWYCLEAILTIPVLIHKSVYEFADGTIVMDEQIGPELIQRFCARYAALDETIYAYDFLQGKSEDDLFELYNKMIDVDSEGILGINKSGLLRIGESEKKLNQLIGLANIKESIKKIKAYALANKDNNQLNIHMCFLGNPGSGKTEVARFIAGILYENKILPTKKIVEVDRSGLVSQYFGATAEKTRSVIQSAMGGVLFIDEAYALCEGDSTHGISDYGKEAIDTLVKAMEDYRGRFCVILAGYKNEMQKMLSTNPGFKSRIQFMLDFPNYSRGELREISQLMLQSRHYSIGEAALERLLDITEIRRKEPNFANAREIRNILDQVIMCQNLRCAGTGDSEVGIVDINKYISDANINLPMSSGSIGKILTGEEELDQLIGLAPVKRMIKKIKAYAKRNKDQAGFNLHMCFYGNPGTGKTEVARILSRILHDAEVLGEAKLVETDSTGLLGSFVGETGPKTQAKIQEAMGGVLFIDEAYGLTGGNTVSGAKNYGEEAIAVLLKEMEDHRGQFCTILAGYQEEMKAMIATNPGFQSRIQFTLEFPDYTREELGEIAVGFLKKRKYDISDDALELLLDVTEYFRNRPNFANARTVRNILDQVLMNQNLRAEDDDDDYLVIIDDVQDYIMDEKIDLSQKAKAQRKIGFAFD